MLAEILIKHKWSKHCLFARTGAEANSIALRIARSKVEKMVLLYVVIMVGMIGISHQICQKNNLNKIHLSGLSTIGIPKT